MIYSNQTLGRSRPPGFSLIEVVMASAIVTILIYAFAGAANMGNNSATVVNQVADENEREREAVSSLLDDFLITSDALIDVVPLADSNHQATFQLPIEVGGNMKWGVWDPDLGPDTASQTKEDWKIRYTVRTVNIDGENVRVLARQILDETETLQLERFVAERLRSGTETPPGFSVIKSGDMWEIKVSTTGKKSCDPGRKVEFHVWPRN